MQSVKCLRGKASGDMGKGALELVQTGRRPGVCRTWHSACVLVWGQELGCTEGILLMGVIGRYGGQDSYGKLVYWRPQGSWNWGPQHSSARGVPVPTLAIIGTCLCVHHNYSHQLGLAFSAVHLFSSLFLWSQPWHSHTLCLIVLLHDVCSLYTFFQFLFPLTAQGPYSLYFPFNFQKQKGREGEEGGKWGPEREREESPWLDYIST